MITCSTTIKKENYCKLYQQVILRTDASLNAFGTCPKCLWDIADHANEPVSGTRRIFFFHYQQIYPSTSLFIFFPFVYYPLEKVIAHTNTNSIFYYNRAIQCLNTLFYILFVYVFRFPYLYFICFFNIIESLQILTCIL